MKFNLKTIALMSALSAGVAGAQTSAAPDRTGNTTNAGVNITNVASATFTDPASITETNPTGNLATPVISNTVTTTVAPKMAFDITYPNGADADGTDTPAGAADNIKTNVVPGSRVVFPYVAVNNGNAGQIISLNSAVAPGASDVVFYAANPDRNNDGILSAEEQAAATILSNNQITVMASGDDPTTQTVENNTGTAQFWMSYVVIGAPGTTTGATPIGTALFWNGTANRSITEQPDPGGDLAYDDLWYQYSRVSFPTVNLTTGSPVSGGVGDSNGGTNVVTPPPTPGTVGTDTPGSGTPDNPTSPDDTPGQGNVPNTPGYTSGGTPIAIINSNSQAAFPVADNNTAPDTVTFTNVITNGGSAQDIVTLVPPTDLPDGVTVVITPTDADPNTPGVQTDADPNTPGTQIIVPAGGTATYTVQVTFPDRDGSANSPVIVNRTPITVNIGVESGNDADANVDSTATDTVYPPAMNFGDSNGAGVGANAAQAPVQTVDPSKEIDRTPTDSPDGTADRTATFPMNLENTGAYNDSYTLSATTTVPGATVRYYGADGQPLPVNTNGQYVTPVVVAGQEITVYAVVDVPAGTTKADYTVSQTARSNYSGITLTDTNDVIRVGAAGLVFVAKFTSQAGVGADSMYVDGQTCTSGAPTATNVAQIGNPAGYTCQNTSFVPGQRYSYQIVSKNTYNTSVTNFILQDDLAGKPFNTITTADITCSDGGRVDLNGSVATCSFGAVPSGASRTMTVNVTIR